MSKSLDELILERVLDKISKEEWEEIRDIIMKKLMADIKKVDFGKMLVDNMSDYMFEDIYVDSEKVSKELTKIVLQTMKKADIVKKK